jgi:3-(3-hydroxy-phenyl)propionate hydroxylase
VTCHFKSYPFEAAHHEPSPPHVDDVAGLSRHSVAIVGAGPVGLTLALSLARQGIRCVLIEADSTVCIGSRAICISRRSLQIFHRLGVLTPFLEKGLPWTDGRSFFRGREVLHFRMPSESTEKLPPMLNIEQFYIEQFLLDEIERHPDLVDMRWATRVTGVERGSDGVIVSVSNGSEQYNLRADWLVACDGGQSFVREALGLQLRGTSYEGRYVIADIMLESDLPTERLAWFDPPSNPGSSVLMHRQPDKVWRIDYQLRKDEDPVEAVKPENVIPRIREHLAHIGETGAWSPIWITMYKAHALTLESYRHGRIFFAGDAAHLVPIFGVRGANSGIDDADNLGWKLASVIRGQAAETLLDSYSDERVYATMENLSYGRKSTEFMAPPNFAFEQMRRAVLTLASRHPQVRSLINPRQSASVCYAGSPLNDPASEEAAFNGGPAVGATFVEVPLSCGSALHLSDLLGFGFTLLHFSDVPALPPEASAIRASVAERGVCLRTLVFSRRATGEVAGVIRDEAGVAFRLYDAQPGTSYLLRPDGHVLARGRRLDALSVERAVLHALGQRELVA